MLDAKIGSKIDHTHTGIEQRRGLVHRRGIRGRKENQVTATVLLDIGFAKAKIHMATQAWKQVCHGNARFRSRGDYFQADGGMTRQQSHQFDPGVTGATDYSDLNHFNVQIIPLEWTAHYTSPLFRDH